MLQKTLKNKKKQILFIIPTLTGGGAERVIVTLLQNLDRSKFQLSLAVIDISGQVFLSDLPGDVEIIDLKGSRVRFAMLKVMRLIWQRRPDVVFSTLGHLNLALAISRPLLPNDVFYIARETSVVSEVIRDTSSSAIWRWAYRQFYSRFDRVICQSIYMARDLIDNFSVSSAKVVVINNPVDRKKIIALTAEAVVLAAKNNEINLLAAGRLVKVKGFDLLIGAIALCDDLPINLTILGEGPLLADLKALTQRFGIAEKVRFLGFQKNPYPYFAQADAFVLSSHYEGFPNVVLEAMACGTPVIATPAVGGTSEILNGLSGCYISREVSSASLAESIRYYFNSPYRRMPESSVAPFALEKIMDAYAAQFEAEASIG